MTGFVTYINSLSWLDMSFVCVILIVFGIMLWLLRKDLMKDTRSIFDLNKKNVDDLIPVVSYKVTESMPDGSTLNTEEYTAYGKTSAEALNIICFLYRLKREQVKFDGEEINTKGVDTF